MVGDAAALASVHVRAWQAAYRGMIPDDHLDGLSIVDRTIGWRRSFAEADPARAVLVAEDPVDGHVCGFAIVGPVRPPATDDLDATVGEVWAINLEPEAWGRGIGSPLLSAAVGALGRQGFVDAILWVVDANTRARRFYEREAWQHDGTVKVDEIGGAPLTELRYVRPLAGSRTE